MCYELPTCEWSVIGPILAKKPWVASRADDWRVLNDIRPPMGTVS